MGAISIINSLKGDRIPAGRESARKDSDFLCQEGSGCDCRGCTNSG